jgi:hypothetical protein
MGIALLIVGRLYAFVWSLHPLIIVAIGIAGCIAAYYFIKKKKLLRAAHIKGARAVMHMRKGGSSAVNQ